MFKVGNKVRINQQCFKKMEKMETKAHKEMNAEFIEYIDSKNRILTIADTDSKKFSDVGEIWYRLEDSEYWTVKENLELIKSGEL